MLSKTELMDNIKGLSIKQVRSYLRNKSTIPYVLLTNKIRHENKGVKTYQAKKLYRGEKRNMLRFIKILSNKKVRESNV